MTATIASAAARIAMASSAAFATDYGTSTTLPKLLRSAT
jgi:hypothetical protein